MSCGTKGFFFVSRDISEAPGVRLNSRRALNDWDKGDEGIAGDAEGEGGEGGGRLRVS